MALIEAVALSVRYPTRRALAVSDLRLSLMPGERLLLAGPSGGGKSTLALCLNGLIPHSLEAEVRGRLLVDGLETRTARPEELAARVGLLFQDPSSQFTMLTVEDEVAFGLENLGVPRTAMEERIAAALVAVGMAAYRQRRLDRLSGGQQQRVALAGLLAMQPQVLVLDEPTAHLDPRMAHHLHALLAALAARGQTLVIIEHQLEPLLTTLERVVALDHQGQLLLDAPLRAALTAQTATIAAAGVRLPVAVQLSRRLAAAGLTLAGPPLTTSEGAAALAAAPAAAAWLARQATATVTATPAPPALATHGLSWQYAAGSPVLQRVSVTVPAGGWTAIIGENGSGKTTLALLLAGLLPPPPGGVTVFGRDLARLSAAEAARLVGFVFQNPEHQFVTDSVWEEVAYGLQVRRQAASSVAERVAELLDEFGLTPLAAANPFTLSRGQQRRLSVAAMLAATPAALILDEPTFGQDDRQATRLLRRLEGLRQSGTTIVVVTHDLGLVAAWATWTIALAHGEVVYEGPPTSLLDDPERLATVGQVQPPWRALLTEARAAGAAVPTSLAWSLLREAAVDD